MLDLFVKESMSVLRNFIILRSRTISQQKLLTKCTGYLMLQEETISELRGYIEEHFTKVFITMEQHNAIHKIYKDANEVSLSG